MAFGGLQNSFMMKLLQSDFISRMRMLAPVGADHALSFLDPRSVAKSRVSVPLYKLGGSPVVLGS